ncbi:hypothetical protein U5922_000520 (plasmid) [Aquicoccus sp. G2-2]|uniref:hypothetical protein n=1 Tax=Aquicoccus sp. G2-2 TaxID=3092120 RepID=UPI002AE0672A|nr:hypothetical protein [Aquicoccus sp. G2-2]MEA1112017.1 hypothetical protein [Aquicoccus sp. G2-2]
MRQEPGSSKTICPYSGTAGEDDEFTHPKDAEAAIKIVKHAAMKDVEEAFSGMLKGIANKSRGGITYKPGAGNRRLKPQFGRRDLMRLLVCDCCGRDYGVYAIALYCPDCGAPNVALHFAREVELVLRQVSIAEEMGEKQSELAYRLLGNAHEDVLTAFEAVQKVVYLHKVSTDPERASSAKTVRNDFQNVEKAQKRYAEFDLDPFQGLSDPEREALDLNIQKRHIIGHNLGVVDAKFAENTRNAKLGETVQLLGNDVRDFARLCQLVVAVLDDWIADVNLSGTERNSQEIEHVIEPSSEMMTIGELSVLATSIGRWICNGSENGLPEHVDEDDLLAAFEAIEIKALEEALAELEMEGCVELSHAIGPKLPRIRATEDLFQVFDPIVMKSNPHHDAVALIDLVLEGDGAVDISELHQRSGLTLRRFNPAVALVLDEIGEGRVSRTYSPDYPARYFAMAAEDRVALKRLRARLCD